MIINENKTVTESHASHSSSSSSSIRPNRWRRCDFGGGADRGWAKHLVVAEVWWIFVPDIVDHAWSVRVDVSWDADLFDIWIAGGALDGDLRAARK